MKHVESQVNWIKSFCHHEESFCCVQEERCVCEPDPITQNCYQWKFLDVLNCVLPGKLVITYTRSRRKESMWEKQARKKTSWETNALWLRKNTNISCVKVWFVGRRFILKKQNVHQYDSASWLLFLFRAVC